MRRSRDLQSLLSITATIAGSLGTTLGASLATAAPVTGDTWQDIGYTDLLKRLGSDIPTGAGIVVGQVEATTATGYGPDQSNEEFAGINFISNSGDPGVSDHATNVARNMFGGATSVAPNVNEVHLWEVNSWSKHGSFSIQKRVKFPLLGSGSYSNNLGAARP